MFTIHFTTAVRNLWKHKTFTFINITGLTIGLTSFILIALYIFDELTFDWLHKHADAIYRVVERKTSAEGKTTRRAGTGLQVSASATTDFPEIKDVARISHFWRPDIRPGNNTAKVFHEDLIAANPGFLTVFSFPLLYGDRNSALTAPKSVVLTEASAQKFFGSSHVVGELLFFDNDPVPYKVTGVLKNFPVNSSISFHLLVSESSIEQHFTNDWTSGAFATYFLLDRNTDIISLNKKLDNLIATHHTSEPGVTSEVQLQALKDVHFYSNDIEGDSGTKGNISYLYVFLVVACFIIFIACVNYMNLSTARSSMRVKEIGIRKVIGSGQGNLVGLFIAEALLIAFIAAAIACFLTEVTLPFFNELSGKTLDIWRFGATDTILFVVAFALLTGFISGSYPALFLARFKMIPSLKGQLGNMHTSVVLRKSLVVFQFIIAVCLISGSFIIYKQLQYVNNKDLGFNKEQVLTFHIDDNKVRSEIPDLKQALLENPAIQGVAVAGNPIGNNNLGGRDFTFEKDGVMQTNSQMAKQLFADDDFLNTTDIKLLQGRNFSKDMPTDKYGAAIINEAMMKQLGYKNAIGNKMQYQVAKDAEMSYRTIVGVVKDFHVYSLQHKIEPMVILQPPADNEQDNLYVKIAKGKTAQGIAFLKSAYKKFDNVNSPDIHFLDENFAKQYEAEQKQEQLSLAFTVMAFVIACLGLLGLVIFTTVQRTKEIGIRKVLGASVTSVTVMLGREFMQLVIIATIIAIPLGWYAMRQWLQDFAYRIEIQWWMFFLSGLAAIIIAMITVCIQAIKAAISNPVKSLRTE